MSCAVVHFSLTGNNAHLARRILREAGGIDCPVVERRRRWLGIGTVILDMARKRRPPIAPLAPDPSAAGAVLFVGPLYDMQVAHPLASAVLQLKDRLGRYAFATLCGYHRDGQEAHIRAELEALAGRPPERVWQFHVGDLLPEEKREDVRTVSRYRVRADELDRFAAGLSEVVDWCRAADRADHS